MTFPHKRYCIWNGISLYMRDELNIAIDSEKVSCQCCILRDHSFFCSVFVFNQNRTDVQTAMYDLLFGVPFFGDHPQMDAKILQDDLHLHRPLRCFVPFGHRKKKCDTDKGTITCAVLFTLLGTITKPHQTGSSPSKIIDSKGAKCRMGYVIVPRRVGSGWW